MTADVQSVVRARVDPEIKLKANRIFDSMGFTTSAAIRMFLVQVIAEGSLPFEVRAPNKLTRDAIAASRAGKVRSFASVDELFADLNDE